MSDYIEFQNLFATPLRNSVSKPSKIRGSGYKMVNMGELFNYSIIRDIRMDLVPLNDSEKNHSLLVNGDLLFARQSLVLSGAGKCSIFLGYDLTCFESHLIRCRLDKKIANPLFYFYFFQSNQGKNLINSIVEQGAGAAGIRGKDLSKLKVLYPSLDKQNYIADILYSYDQKIELNTQTNQTLEQIAQAIFKSWFVDFDPVKAKMDVLANGGTPEQAELQAMQIISGKTAEELEQMQHTNPEQYKTLAKTTALFPSEMVESELGDIPKGWEVKNIGSLLISTIGGDWGKDSLDERYTEKVAVFRGTDLPEVYVGKNSSVPTRFVEIKKLKSRQVQDGDIIIEISGGSKNQSTGRTLLITNQITSRYSTPIIPASFCRLLRPINRNIGVFLGIYFRKIYQEGKMWQYQNQSTGISNFQTKIFLENEILAIPSNNILDAFVDKINPIIDKLYSNENNRLAEIRDNLLPKLLSGDITI